MTVQKRGLLYSVIVTAAVLMPGVGCHDPGESVPADADDVEPTLANADGSSVAREPIAIIPVKGPIQELPGTPVSADPVEPIDAAEPAEPVEPVLSQVVEVGELGLKDVLDIRRCGVELFAVAETATGAQLLLRSGSGWRQLSDLNSLVGGAQWEPVGQYQRVGQVARVWKEPSAIWYLENHTSKAFFASTPRAALDPTSCGWSVRKERSKPRVQRRLRAV